MYVVKRDSTIVPFEADKIERAILKAMTNGSGIIKEKIAKDIAAEIQAEFLEKDTEDEELEVSVYDIEQRVFDKLITKKQRLTAKAYEGYRSVREFQRENNTIDNKVFGLVEQTAEDIKDNSNKNPVLISTMRDLVAEEVSKDISVRMLLPTHIAKAHNDGLIYIHDLGHYLNPSFNCCLVNIKDMLANGTVINGKLITRPHSFRTASTITTQIIAQVASGQFGGQTISLSHLAPFVRDSYHNYLKKYLDWGFSDQQAEEYAWKDLRKEVKDGIQTFQYQINTLQTSNGQAPFLSVMMYIDEDPEYKEETIMLIEEMLKQRIKGMQNEAGAWIAPAFPKLLYVLDENNCKEDREYWWLTKLACECVTKRMMPDFLSAKKLREHHEGNVVGPMGCRAFLSPYKGGINNTEGEYKLWGRFNMGLTSINLADAGLSAEGDIEEFWEILDSRLGLCFESLMLRYNKLKNVTSDVSPIHWQHGAIARLGKHEPIYPLLQDGYATISLGYMGVYECVKALIGESNTTEKGRKLALEIVQHLKDATVKWKKKTGLGFALYGTPAESLTQRFAELTRKRWGVIEGITDKDYLTNSFHVNVREEIDPYEKILYEADFQAISTGGKISYIECVNLTQNPEAIENVVKFIYDTTDYCEFNTKLDNCMECGYEGEMICDDNLHWYCPNCGNRDTDRMTIVRRTCGYLGENLWNKGRTQEIKERYVHLDNHEIC